MSDRPWARAAHAEDVLRAPAEIGAVSRLYRCRGMNRAMRVPIWLPCPERV